MAEYLQRYLIQNKQQNEIALVFTLVLFTIYLQHLIYIYSKGYNLIYNRLICR